MDVLTGPMMTKTSQSELNRAVRKLAERDPYLRQTVSKYGSPKSRRSKAGFATVARIVVDQQISTAAAASIWAKLSSAVGRVNASNIANTHETDLKSAGLSAGKAKTLRSLSNAVESREFTFQGLSRRSDDEVRAALTRIWGIGDWTADIYLMFGMGRPDVWPAGDLALRTGWQCITDGTERIAADDLAQLAEAWRPYRSAAAVLLWHGLKHSKKAGKKA